MDAPGMTTIGGRKDQRTEVPRGVYWHTRLSRERPPARGSGSHVSVKANDAMIRRGGRLWWGELKEFTEGGTRRHTGGWSADCRAVIDGHRGNPSHKTLIGMSKR